MHFDESLDCAALAQILHGWADAVIMCGAAGAPDHG
jgi:hypothetical protein